MFLEKVNDKNRNAADRRQQREKAIAKKVRILKSNFFWRVEDLNERSIGKLDKGKVHCSCKMCKFEKHYKIEDVKYKNHREQSEQELKKYIYK